jgi:hypothetical protein
MKPAHAQDLRITCARQFTVARVVGVRLGAHLPHNTHPVMSFAIDVWARQPTWEAHPACCPNPPRRCIRANGYGFDHSWVHLPVLDDGFVRGTGMNASALLPMIDDWDYPLSSTGVSHETPAPEPPFLRPQQLSHAHAHKAGCGLHPTLAMDDNSQPEHPRSMAYAIACQTKSLEMGAQWAERVLMAK